MAAHKYDDADNRSATDKHTSNSRPERWRISRKKKYDAMMDPAPNIDNKHDIVVTTRKEASMLTIMLAYACQRRDGGARVESRSGAGYTPIHPSR